MRLLIGEGIVLGLAGLFAMVFAVYSQSFLLGAWGFVMLVSVIVNFSLNYKRLHKRTGRVSGEQ